MNHHELQELLAQLADEFDVPGVAAGVWHAGKTSFACHGVTGIESPLPIDVHTLFQAGSIGKALICSHGPDSIRAPVAARTVRGC